MSAGTSAFPGVPDVINGNGAVAYVMKHVCGGVIGYPITPSTEISEIFEAARAEGQLNVWGKHPFFVETEGEHSAQSGALGAALTGGNFISNASSSQGILYGLESHYVTAGKKIGGFVLQVAARVVTKHSLNVMAGHDDVYALLPSGYTILFGSNPQEAADRVGQMGGVITASVTLHWPNDVYVEGRKLAGILVEAGVRHAVLGIGVNVLGAPDLGRTAPVLPPVSLADVCARPPSREALLIGIVKHLADHYEGLARGQVRELVDAYTCLDMTVGMGLTLQVGAQQVHGVATGIDDNGALVLSTGEGLRRFVAGEVHIDPGPMIG